MATKKIWRSRITGHGSVDPETLTVNPKNHRTHPMEQREVVRDSIAELGFVKSVLVNKTTGFIVDGHERVWQALDAKKTDPTVTIDVEYVELSEAEEAKALAILDASTEMAIVDPAKLEELLAEVSSDSEAVNQMLDEMANDAGLIEELEVEDIEPQIDRADVLMEEWGTAEGQLWIIEGKQTHRLLCGDSTKAVDVGRLMDGASDGFCFTSPPYSDQREYTNESNCAVDHLAGIFAAAKLHVGVWAVNLGLSRKDGFVNQYWNSYINAARDVGIGLLSWNVWNRPTTAFSVGNITAMFPISHEWVLVFGSKTEKLIPIVENKFAGEIRGSTNRDASGKMGGKKNIKLRSHRELGTVFECQTVSNNEDHPAMFPIEFPTAYIRSIDRENVYDPFLGSGTTMLAAEQLNRRCYGMEISPKYCAVILQRMLDAGCVCKEQECQALTH